MNLSSLIILPFILQGMAIFFDEFYFHHKRGLPRWERIGHPLDTLTVLSGFLFLLLMPASVFNLGIYIGLAVFSCLFVTKDEAVHLKYCTAAEGWLHAVLFILHPLTFISAGLIWYSSISNELSLFSQFHSLLLGQALITGGFLLYQIGYWNFYAKRLS